MFMFEETKNFSRVYVKIVIYYNSIFMKGRITLVVSYSYFVIFH